MSEALDQQTILVVDDDDVLRATLVRAFAGRGFTATGARDYDEALAVAERDPPELCVVDLRMPGRGGLELLEALKRMEPEIAVVVLSGYGSIATAIDALRLGAVYFLPKPADADEILAAFARGAAPPSTDVSAARAPSLARAEWEHIQRVLADCEGNVSEAARRLGIHRRSLQRKLQKQPPCA
ncbi:MAG: response regulator [Sorangiineae bacterium]|nr:response regulator [Polyangiaceae bacterium]MEB2324403.1 response regulator [Sorangiineae bacterium]